MALYFQLRRRDMDREEPEAGSEDDARRRAWTYAVILMGTFVILGIVFAIMAFPELSTPRAALAGACFGGFLALCSITYSAF